MTPLGSGWTLDFVGGGKREDHSESDALRAFLGSPAGGMPEFDRAVFPRDLSR
jgi:hypothetical protein